MKTFLMILCGIVCLSFTPEKRALLYRSLDPDSVAEHLALYQLFPDTPEGLQALNDAWKLLAGENGHYTPLPSFPKSSIEALIALVGKVDGATTQPLPPQDLNAIHELASRLPNRKLKGCFAKTEAELLALPSNEIDLSRALLLVQADENPHLKDSLDSYEALLDLMALQLLTRIHLNDSPEKKIRILNQFIFEEMGYRFPPHSVYAKDIDLYTYLPSVMDSRRGVCLGVSTLYLCLSQRLELPLEAVTPPGHIYVRYHLGDKTINIETTARGIHLDTKEYLGIETETLPIRSIKDVIGLAYFNEASVHWHNENYTRALHCYQKAALYLPDDLLLQELMGYNYLFVGDEEKGRALIQKVFRAENQQVPIAQKTVVEDYLKGHVDGEGIRMLFLHVDEKRDSLLNKKQKLENTLLKWPSFRAGYFHLAVVWLQLHRQKEALQALETYVSHVNNDPSAEYLLAQLHALRSNYPQSWKHLHHAEELLKGRSSLPETLIELRRELAERAPE